MDEGFTENTAPKQRGRPFQKGQSGNIAGKPKGARSRATLVLEALVDKQGPALIKKAIAMALDGDSAVLRALLPLLLPARKDRPVQFELPVINSAADAVNASKAILAGASDGVLTPGEAGELGKLLEGHAKLLEVHDLEARLRDLETARGIPS